MTIRVIYYTADDRKKDGDLQMRRKSMLFEDHNFQFQDVFSLSEEGGKWFIEPINQSILFSDEELISGKQPIKNGFTFNSADTFYKIVHELSYVPRSSMGRFISFLTAVIILLILFSELFLVVWLPKKWSQLADLSKQVTIQKSEIKIDSVRNRFRHKVKGATLSQQEAQIFLFKEVNRIADYFRDNREKMSIKEVQSMYDRIKGYEQLADMIERGINFDRKVEPRIGQWLEVNCKDKQDEKTD